MKNMKSAKEFSFKVPPPGRYFFKITSAEAKVTTTSGEPQISLTGEIREPEEHSGAKFWDNIGTDGTTNFGAFGKTKLLGLGVQGLDSDEEIPDGDIAQSLVGAEGWADFTNEPSFGKNPLTGKYDVVKYDLVDGKQVPQQKLVLKRYLGPVNPDSVQVEQPVADAPVEEAAPAAPAPTAKAAPTPAAATPKVQAAAPVANGVPKPAGAVPPWQAAALKAKQTAATKK